MASFACLKPSLLSVVPEFHPSFILSRHPRVYYRTNAIWRQSQCNHRDRLVEIEDPVPNKFDHDPFAPEEFCTPEVVEEVDLILEADEAIALEVILSPERLGPDEGTETISSLGAL